MTREETVKILAILKAAYPNSYKGMTKEEANGTITVWSMQLANIPANIVLMAVNKIISVSPYTPAISEVKDKIRSLYYEAREMLSGHEYSTEYEDPLVRDIYETSRLDEKRLATVKEIIRVTEPLVRGRNNELSLNDMLTSSDNYLLTDGENAPKQN